MGAQRKKLVIVAVIMALALLSEARGQTTICGMTSEGLTACKPSVSGANAVPPSSSCCSALEKADLKCLCNLKKNYPGILYAYNIDPKQALELPGKCGRQESLDC